MNKNHFILLMAIGLVLYQSRAYCVDQLRVMALFPNKAMVSIDGTKRVLHQGKPAPEGVRLISADSRRAVIQVDGRQAVYHIDNHIQSRFIEPDAIEAKIWRNDSGSYTTRGHINGQSVSMLVDTGATSVAMNRREAKRLGIDYRDGEPVTVGTASGQAAAHSVTLKRIRVGGIEMRDIDAVVVDGDNPPAVLLGMSFLERVSMNNLGSLLTLRTHY